MSILPCFPHARKAFRNVERWSVERRTGFAVAKLCSLFCVLRSTLLLLALTAILLTQQSQPAQAQAPSQCGGRQDCLYAFLISQCTDPDVMPPRYTQLYVQVHNLNTNQVREHRLIVESQGPGEYLYSVLVLELNPDHRYSNRFVRSGVPLNDWSEEWRPPTSVGMLEVFVCQQVYLPYILGR